jgi:LPS sulfotransferase NodH
MRQRPQGDRCHPVLPRQDSKLRDEMTGLVEIQEMLETAKITPVIVLARSRTGSNLLVSLLNSHPLIRIRGEKCARLHGQDIYEVLKTAFSARSPKVCLAGFKLFYYHPNDQDSDLLWQTLVALPNLKVIHLRRENILRTLLSRKIASVQDVWKNSGETADAEGVKPRLTVHLSQGELEKGFTQTRGWEQWGEQLFREHAMHAVTYEELVEDRDETMERLFEFLGVEGWSTETVLEKQNTQRLSELIENYDDLCHAFQNTPWSGFFNE